jgi:hypothetical protein
MRLFLDARSPSFASRRRKRRAKTFSVNNVWIFLVFLASHLFGSNYSLRFVFLLFGFYLICGFFWFYIMIDGLLLLFGIWVFVGFEKKIMCVGKNGYISKVLDQSPLRGSLISSVFIFYFSKNMMLSNWQK